MNPLLRWGGRGLARYLSRPRRAQASEATSPPELLLAALRRGDVLLVEGSTRLSTAIMYITQSTWSHAALYAGELDGVEGPALIEADVQDGVRVVPLSRYQQQHTRICRPVGLSGAEIDAVVAFMQARIGYQYDLKNVFDLARYLIQQPPVSRQRRRRLLALGSGDPTRAICSSLVAEAFQSVRYPILPEIEHSRAVDPASEERNREILHIRHHSLYAPRDFDVSPYFQVVKPRLVQGFDPHQLTWGDTSLADS